jgi:hypothetical protein
MTDLKATMRSSTKLVENGLIWGMWSLDTGDAAL